MASPLADYHAIVRLLMRSVYDTRYDVPSMEKALDRIYELLSRDPAALPFPFVFGPEPQRPPTPPSLVIHPDQGSEEIIPSAIVMVTKEEPEVRNVVVNASSAPLVAPVPVPAGPAKPSATDAAILKALRKEEEEEEESDDDSTASPGVESEDEEEEEEEGLVSTGTPADSDSESESDVEEEEEEEDEDLTLKTIKGEKYYWSPSSKRVYECLEEGYGDCIGTFENGKLVRK